MLFSLFRNNQTNASDIVTHDASCVDEVATIKLEHFQNFLTSSSRFPFDIEVHTNRMIVLLLLLPLLVVLFSFPFLFKKYSGLFGLLFQMACVSRLYTADSDQSQSEYTSDIFIPVQVCLTINALGCIMVILYSNFVPNSMLLCFVLSQFTYNFIKLKIKFLVFFQISSTDVSFNRGETATITLTSRIPFGCPSSVPECKLQFEVFDPDDNYRCWYSSVALVHSNTCGDVIIGNNQPTSKHIVSRNYVLNITLTTIANERYYQRNYYGLNLKTHATGNSKSVWNSFNSALTVCKFLMQNYRFNLM